MKLLKDQRIRFFLFIFGLPILCIIIGFIIGSFLPGILTGNNFPENRSTIEQFGLLSSFILIWLPGQLIMWMKSSWSIAQKRQATAYSLLTIPLIFIAMGLLLSAFMVFIFFFAVLANFLSCLFKSSMCNTNFFQM